jgi:hypothetical protein
MEADIEDLKEAVEQLCGYEEEASWVDVESGDFETRE